MPHDDRRWTSDGDRITGTATDGRPDQILIALPSPLTPAGSEPTPDHLARIDDILALLNGLTPSQKILLTAIRRHEITHDWPATATDLQLATGLSMATVYAGIDDLADLGMVDVPPKSERPRRRVVRTLIAEGPGQQ